MKWSSSLKLKVSEHSDGSIGIAFQMSKEANDFLNQACERSGRTKKSEAKMRLEDHLQRFVSITEIGNVSERG